MDLEEDARRVLGLPCNILNIRAVKDELLGDVGDELGSSSLSFAATSIQEPVREVCSTNIVPCYAFTPSTRRLLEGVGGTLLRTLIENPNMM